VKILFGHIIILLSIGQVFAQNADGIKLIEYSQSTCDRKSDPNRLKPRIISFEHHSDTLRIEIGFAVTCCIEYTPNVKYSTDTLYLSYVAKDEDEACACVCCYSFNHKITGIASSKLTVKLFDRVIELSNEKYWTYEPVFTLIEDDTLNQKDKYGLRQGIWIDAKADFTKHSVSFQRYKDDRLDQWGHLYKNLAIKDEYDPRTKITREYYENGRIKKECHETDDKAVGKCRQWKKNGEEIMKD
jgi:hypothetical protein